MADASRWSAHASATEPAGFAAQIAALPADVSALCRSVQGLLVHIDCLALHGLDPASMAVVSRTTLPVRERLGRLAALGPLDLAAGRPPAGRQVGTCRDFALLLCSFLRVHGVPARVRCGFASYFGAGWWDHWICERWDAGAAAWRRTDAGLDPTMRAECRVAFDPSDMPDGAFLTAGEAWLACRAGRLSFDDLGHGEHRGPWFVSVNVARDSLSLDGREMSPWDTWREAEAEARRLPADQLPRVDDLARHPERPPEPPTPPWWAPHRGSRGSS